jgi:hypothetical protein
MRLLIVGPLGGQISAATKIAMEHGAKVAHVDTIEQATAAVQPPHWNTLTPHCDRFIDPRGGRV